METTTYVSKQQNQPRLTGIQWDHNKQKQIFTVVGVEEEIT